MEEIINYLKECQTFYLATTDGNQPRVRPFGAVAAFEGKLYIVTNNKKKVFAQLLANPRIEISGMNKGTWLRLEATAISDNNRAAREYVLEEYPSLKNMYNPDDGIMEVLYLKDASASICEFGKEPKHISF